MQHQNPRIFSVGTAVPAQKYTQLEIADLLALKSEKSKRFFLNEHIKTRHLCEFDRNTEQRNSALLHKFRKNAVHLSKTAIDSALEMANLNYSQIDFLCCVTSTGFIVPALSLLLIEHLGLRSNCEKLDIVGMGCSAGVNGLSAATNWCRANPDKVAIVVCCEISSAIYSLDESENTALVNSLFGDGAAAAVISTKADSNAFFGPRIIKFSSFTIPHSLLLLRFDWSDEDSRYRFYVDKETPAVLGANIKQALDNLIGEKDKHTDIQHWIFHSGGTAILDRIERELQLQPTELRHTRSVLKKYGNVSSGSALFSLKELVAENAIKQNDRGVMVTMGPGLTIEMALLQW